MYMQIYVKDLRRRLSIFDELSVECNRLPSPRLVLYPWLLTFASPRSAFDGGGGTPVMQSRPADGGRPSFYVQFVSVFIIWLLGPTVLFALWVRFIGHGDPTSIIPCACLIGALYSLAPAPGNRRVVTIVITAVGLGLLTTTAASVPNFRNALALDHVWQYLRAVGPAVWSGIDRFGITITYAVIVTMTLGRFASGLIRPAIAAQLHDWFLRRWVEASDSKRSPLLTALLEAALERDAAIQSLFVIAGIIVGIIIGVVRLASGI